MLGEPLICCCFVAALSRADAKERKKERKKWRTSLSPKAMGPRAVAGGECASAGGGALWTQSGKTTDHQAPQVEPG